MMVKHVVFLAGLSIVAVMFQQSLDHVLSVATAVHQHLIGFLSLIFSDDRIGQVVQGVLALLLIPAIIALLVSTVYWVTRRGKMPYVWHVLWGSWLVLLTTFAIKGV